MSNRKPETMLFFSQNLLRKKLGKRSLKNVPLLKSLEFEADRDLSSYLCQPSIQIRIADFYTKRLGHSVELKQIVICDAHFEIHVEKTIERRSSDNLSIVLLRYC